MIADDKPHFWVTNMVLPDGTHASTFTFEAPEVVSSFNFEVNSLYILRAAVTLKVGSWCSHCGTTWVASCTPALSGPDEPECRVTLTNCILCGFHQLQWLGMQGAGRQAGMVQLLHSGVCRQV